MDKDALVFRDENLFTLHNIVNGYKEGRCYDCSEIGRFRKYRTHTHAKTTGLGFHLLKIHKALARLESHRVRNKLKCTDKRDDVSGFT